jgi:hypothetical protein
MRSGDLDARAHPTILTECDLSGPAAHYQIRNRPQALRAEAAAVDIRAVMYPSMLPVIDELSLPLV